jgi:hypothetical protein
MTLAASGQPAISVTWRCWPGAGPGIEQLAGAIAERPGGVSRQVAVLGGGVQANASGFDALTERGHASGSAPITRVR